MSMLVSSSHPAEAGLQTALAELIQPIEQKQQRALGGQIGEAEVVMLLLPVEVTLQLDMRPPAEDATDLVHCGVVRAGEAMQAGRVLLESQGKSDLLNQLRSVLPSYATCIYIRQPAPLGLGHAVLCALIVHLDRRRIAVDPDAAQVEHRGAHGPGQQPGPDRDVHNRLYGAMTGSTTGAAGGAKL